MSDGNTTPPGWYYAEGDPPGTQRYWDGNGWQGGPQPVAAGPQFNDSGSDVGSLADPGKRILGRLIDFIIWIVISVVVTIIFGGASVDGTNFATNTSFFASLIGALALFGYEFFLVATRGQTVGKMVMNTRVARLDGGEITYETSGKRALLLLVGIIPVLGGLVQLIAGIASLVMLFTDSQNQTVWDKIAGTTVVDA